MFSRLVGTYALTDLVACAFPGSGALDELKAFLPLRPFYFYGAGRQALFSALCQLRLGSEGRRYVALPSWGCPIVLATVAKAGFRPLLMDVSPETLHMDISHILAASQTHDIAAAILVAENGIPYSAEDVESLRSQGIVSIGDYALAWQNIAMLVDVEPDYEVFSGGFSKPISGLGLGVLTTRCVIPDPPESYKEKTLKNTVRVLAHLVLQQGWVYRLIGGFLPRELEKDFDGVCEAPSPCSAVIVLHSARRVQALTAQWRTLQTGIRAKLHLRQSQCALIHQGTALQSKVVMESGLLNCPNGSGIEFHKQYAYDLLKDPRSYTLDSSYEMSRQLRDNYISFSINSAAIKRSSAFLRALEHALVPVKR